MKKIVCTMLCIMLLFGLSACGGDVSEVKTHNVESESYSEEDIKAAIDTIKRSLRVTGKDALSQKFTMPEMTARKIIKIGQIGTMQMKSLFCYLHSMLIHLEEMVL
ncbi:MAG: hypothetical protein ACLS5W_02065 [Coprococcus sp.]